MSAVADCTKWRRSVAREARPLLFPIEPARDSALKVLAGTCLFEAKFGARPTRFGAASTEFGLASPDSGAGSAKCGSDSIRFTGGFGKALGDFLGLRCPMRAAWYGRLR